MIYMELKKEFLEDIAEKETERLKLYEEMETNGLNPQVKSLMDEKNNEFDAYYSLREKMIDLQTKKEDLSKKFITRIVNRKEIKAIGEELDKLSNSISLHEQNIDSLNDQLFQQNLAIAEDNLKVEDWNISIDEYVHERTDEGYLLTVELDKQRQFQFSNTPSAEEIKKVIEKQFDDELNKLTDPQKECVNDILTQKLLEKEYDTYSEMISESIALEKYYDSQLQPSAEFSEDKKKAEQEQSELSQVIDDLNNSITLKSSTLADKEVNEIHSLLDTMSHEHCSELLNKNIEKDFTKNVSEAIHSHNKEHSTDNKEDKESTNSMKENKAEQNKKRTYLNQQKEFDR